MRPRPGLSPRLREWAPVAVRGALLLLVPAIFTRVPFFTMGTAVLMGIMAIATLGLTVLMGYAGQISIGQAAFFGIGAFTSAILTTKAGLPPVLALVVGILLSAALAWVVGLAIFRVSGHYLALATIAFGLVLGFLARQLEITGGASGIFGVPRLAIGSLYLRTDLAMYYLVAALLLVALVITRNLTRSMYGRSLLSIGDSEIAAASSGLDTAKHKRTAFVVAAVLASLAGSLQAHWITFVDYHTLDLMLSIQILIMATIGGLGTVWGAPVGAFLVIALSQAAKELLPKVFPNVGGQFEIVIYGVALIAVLLFLPKGVVGSLAEWRPGRRRGGRGPGQDDAAEHELTEAS
jgi:branched-chain amino acid transport system permease protein